MAREVPQYISQLSIGSMPKMQYSMAQANATQRISEQLGQLGQQIHDKDIEIATLRADTEMKTTAARQYDEFGHDPGQLKAAQDSFGEKFIAGLPEEVQEKAKAAWSNYTLPYMTKSTDIYKDNQDKTHKLSILEGLPVTVKSGEVALEGIESDVPEYQDNSYRALGTNAGVLERMKAARNHDGSAMFEPSEILAAEHKIQKALEKKANAIRLAPAEKLLYDNPAELALKISDGEFDNRLSQKEKESYLKKSLDRQEDIQKRESVIGILRLAKDNQELAEAYQSNSPDLPRLIEEAEDKGADPKIIETIKKNVIKFNKLPADVAQAEYNDLMGRVSQLDKKGRISGKFSPKDVSLEELSILNSDLQRASVRGVKNLTPFMRRIQPLLLEKAKNERGHSDAGFDIFGMFERDEIYDAGYEIINAHLKASNQMEDGAKREALITKFVAGMEDLPPEIKADPLKFDKAMDEMAQRVVKADGKSRYPISRTLGDAPNGVINTDGKVETLGDFKSDIKPDQKVTDTEVRLLKDKSGKLAREYLKDGKRVKLEVLNTDGTVKREVLY